MRWWGKFGIALIAGLGLLWLLWVSPAAAQDSLSANITSPKTGDSLFATVAISGTATNTNFERYKLEYQSAISQDWVLITEIKQQVTNGVLAQWKTTDVPDGRYQLRLRVILRNGTVLQAVVQNLTINNQQPTALPTPLPTVTPIPPTLSPTVGPSPTPLIQQPPTTTLRPTAAVIVVPTAVLPAQNNVAPPTIVVFQSLRNAFCGGIYLAIAGFIILGVYSIVRSRLRPNARRQARPTVNE